MENEKQKYVYCVHSGWGKGLSSYWATYTCKEKAWKRARQVSGHGYVKRSKTTQQHFDTLAQKGY